MKISGSYGTHMGPLMACVNKTKGDVLEMGMGLFSTPYLHYMATVTKRNVLSLDNDKGWARKFISSDFSHYLYGNEYHKLEYVKSWDTDLIEKDWDVVLVDHSPSERRIVDVKRLANKAQYIIIHDTNERHEKEYHYSEIYPLFKYKRVWDKDDRHATVLSNFNNLDNLW
jgi:hypothetical protein